MCPSEKGSTLAYQLGRYNKYNVSTENHDNAQTKKHETVDKFCF